MIQINCDGCCKCCHSKITKSFYYEDKAFIQDIEDPNSRDEISNKVMLLAYEIKNFYDYGFGRFLKFSQIIGDENKTSATVMIKTFPKFIDNQWVMACSFLDSHSKKCRIHNTLLYPTICKIYPHILIFEKIHPLCNKDNVPTEIPQSEITKIKESDLRLRSQEVYMEICEGFSTFKKRVENNPRDIVPQLLYGSFGKPTHLNNNLGWIFEQVQKEIEYQQKNFK